MTTGQWLFAEATETGDWESAALALRAELVKATADRDALIASMEHAWSLVSQAAAVEPDVDPLAAFDVELVR